MILNLSSRAKKSDASVAKDLLLNCEVGMNFSFNCNLFSFAKSGKIGYISFNGKRVLTIVGGIYVVNLFGKEFTNKELIQ